METPLYTIGHSHRTADELIGLLRARGIQTVVDIRSSPQSARYPQFGQDNLRHSLDAAQMVYHWAGRQLGGLRSTASNSIHHALDTGLQGFAQYMQTPEFARAAAQLQRLATQATTAMLCAEKLPEHCHRSLIADFLLLAGMEVMHIIDADTTVSHQLRPEARRESATLVYDRVV